MLPRTGGVEVRASAGGLGGGVVVRRTCSQHEGGDGEGNGEGWEVQQTAERTHGPSPREQHPVPWGVHNHDGSGLAVVCVLQKRDDRVQIRVTAGTAAAVAAPCGILERVADKKKISNVLADR
jgi:hypothetical protein